MSAHLLQIAQYEKFASDSWLELFNAKFAYGKNKKCFLYCDVLAWCSSKCVVVAAVVVVVVAVVVVIVVVAVVEVDINWIYDSVIIFSRNDSSWYISEFWGWNLVRTRVIQTSNESTDLRYFRSANLFYAPKVTFFMNPLKKKNRILWWKKIIT